MEETSYTSNHADQENAESVYSTAFSETQRW